MQLYKPLSSGATVNIFDKYRVGPGRQDASEWSLQESDLCTYQPYEPIRGKFKVFDKN